MSNSKFYTRRGDDGYTGLLGPERVPKYDARPEAFGTIDEAQAVLGLARATGCTPRSSQIALEIQRDCYLLMAELAGAGNRDSPFAGSITAGHVERLERWTGELEHQIELPREFVIPGDSPSGAAFHVARTVVRRAERLVSRMVHDGLLTNEQLLRYLNRLSSLLFIVACFEDQTITGARPTLVNIKDDLIA